MSGWVAMRRDWQEHALFDGDEFSRRDAWMWLVANAAWRPTRVRAGGRLLDLERGQLAFSNRFLAEKWGWTNSRTDRFLRKLLDEGMLEWCSKIGTVAGQPAGQPAGQSQRIITICNYAQYQDHIDDRRDDGRDTQFTESGTVAGQRRTREQETIIVGGGGNAGAREAGPDLPEPGVGAVVDLPELASQCCRWAGVSFATAGRANAAINLVGTWVKAGADPPLIREVIVGARDAATEPVNSLRYFDAAILRQIAIRDHVADFNGKNGHDRKHSGFGKPQYRRSVGREILEDAERQWLDEQRAAADGGAPRLHRGTGAALSLPERR